MDLVPKREQVYLKTEVITNESPCNLKHSLTLTDVNNGFSFSVPEKLQEISAFSLLPISPEAFVIKIEIPDTKLTNKIESNEKLEPVTEELSIKDQTVNETSSSCYSCDVCDYKTTSKIKLHWHKFSHSDETVFCCNECEYKTPIEENFHKHALMHVRENPFQCKICGCGATQQYYFQRHMLTHTKEKPFKCKLCDYKASQKHHIKRHLLTHTNKKPFQCNLCDYKTADKHAFLKHEKNHVEEKFFKCNQCNFRTTVKRNFLMHTHTVEQLKTSHGMAENTVWKPPKFSPSKSFKCDKCNYRTVVERNFRMHMPIHVEVPPQTLNEVKMEYIEKTS